MAETLSLFEEIFSKSGILSKLLPGYEERHGQEEMALSIWKAFSQDQNALFEAGTGIGKTLAYLIPALLRSHQTGEKIVISTYTISLQEQLYEKDIPLLVDALGLDLHVVLAKGMRNYLCQRKTSDLSKQHGFYDYETDELLNWSRKTGDGTRSAVPFAIKNETWNQVFAESDACSYVKCPHYNSCFFFKARNRMQTADIIIVNHHLLMAHLLAEEERAILPPFSRLIIDEAHHLEEVARSSLTQTLDRISLFKILAKVHSDAHPEVSRLFQIRDLVVDDKMKSRLNIDLPGEKRELVTSIQKVFDLLDQLHFEKPVSSRWRIRPSSFQDKQWQGDLANAFGEMKELLKRFAASLTSIEDDLTQEQKQLAENPLLDIEQLAQKIGEIVKVIDTFFKECDVRWGEKRSEGVSISCGTLDVAPFLQEQLFKPLGSAILCSATLAVDGGFDYVKENLGMEQTAIEQVISSPFDYKNRTRLLGISNLPPPNDYHFIREASRAIQEAIEISNGGAFVLFTSYDMLKKCSEQVNWDPLLIQGDHSRNRLLQEFKAKQNAVLFGTDSFWEGVDVAGDALRLVIIVKLPFPVPSDPHLEARSELLKQQGRDPFQEDSIPQAVTKFKQGFGRLMRSKQDRGCILCLDQRLFTRSYGKTFIRSLPECVVSFAQKEMVWREMEEFYGA